MMKLKGSQRAIRLIENEFGKTLIIVAHPDDETLGCGGTIARIINAGGDVRVIIMGEGSSGRFENYDAANQKIRSAIEQRRQCAVSALKILGVDDVIFHELPCGRFDTVPALKINKIIEKEIAEYKPKSIFTHFYDDTNIDHRAIFNSVNIATRPIWQFGVPNVYLMEILSSTEWRYVNSFQPNLFVDIRNNIQQKIDAFDCYAASEAKPFPFPRSPEGLLNSAHFRGMQVGIECAESFYTVRKSILE